jgi:hypothetical protein
LHVVAIHGCYVSQKRVVGLMSDIMRYVPPCSLLEKWMTRSVSPDSARLTPAYDDVLDVLKAFLQAIPVDADWYKAEYPAVADFLLRSPFHTATSHFQKHGYFEGRRPFAPGWRGLVAPVPFAQLKTSLRINPARGRLRADIARDDFLSLIKTILTAVPVDEAWYRATYRKAAKGIEDGRFASAIDHYAKQGYFDGCLPFDIAVDDEWYASRYDHVMTGLQRGVAKSAQDHFIRVGYTEGCRPTPP